MTLPIKSLDEIEVKAEVSENDKILILDSETDEARLASKDELKWDKWDQWDKWDKWDTGATWPQWPKGDTWATWPKGDTGAKWDKGDKGNTGDKWDKWDKWDTWAAATVTVWSTTTGNPWTDASVTNSGTTSAAVLNFTIPKWAKGDTWATWQTWATGNWITEATSSKNWKTTTVTLHYTNGGSNSFTVQDWADWQGSGDMSASTYDPNNKMADAFDYDNFINTPTIPTNTSDLNNDSWFITNAVNDLVNYYKKSETYTQTEVNNLISNFWWFEVVATLPSSDIKTNVIYLKWPIGSWADKYEEWIYSNNTWVLIGETSVDLTNYFNKSTDSSDNITEWSTNLFLTSAERTKLWNTSGTNTWDQSASDFDIKDLADSTSLRSAWSGKQDALVNQTNIKSINGNSLLGSGDLTIAAWVTSVNWNTWAVTVNEVPWTWTTDYVLTKTSNWYWWAAPSWWIENDTTGTTTTVTKIWAGTEAEYALITPDATTIYYVF